MRICIVENVYFLTQRRLYDSVLKLLKAEQIVFLNISDVCHYAFFRPLVKVLNRIVSFFRFILPGRKNP